MRALVVDDNPETRVATASLVRSCGIPEVFTAADGDEALSKLSTVRPGVIVTDCQMPGMDGIRLVRALRSAGVAIPIIMCSSLADPAVLSAAMRAGASQFLPKSAMRSRLAHVLHECLSPAARAA
jgi:CheY-like chemotaxis protein